MKKTQSKQEKKAKLCFSFVYGLENNETVESPRSQLIRSSFDLFFFLLLLTFLCCLSSLCQQMSQKISSLETFPNHNFPPLLLFHCCELFQLCLLAKTQLVGWMREFHFQFSNLCNLWRFPKSKSTMTWTAENITIQFHGKWRTRWQRSKPSTLFTLRYCVNFEFDISYPTFVDVGKGNNDKRRIEIVSWNLMSFPTDVEQSASSLCWPARICVCEKATKWRANGRHLICGLFQV